MADIKNRKRYLLLMIISVITVFSAFALSGCRSDRIGGTINEPDITPEYLEGDYSEQLLRDGAQKVFGNIAVTGENEQGIQITITEKEYIPDESCEAGYYIADLNRSCIAYISDDSRMTYLEEGAASPEVTDKETFKDRIGEVPDERLYDIYLFEDQVILILSHSF